MESVLLAIHLIVTIALVAVILLQRSEGGALGISGGPAGLMSSRGAADLLTKATGWLAALFLINALAMGWLAARTNTDDSIIQATQELEAEQQEVPGLPDLPSLPDDDGSN